jgi:hypothetical protein
MVFVEGEAGEPSAAPPEAAGLAPTVVTTQAETTVVAGNMPAAAATSDIEQLAAAGAAMIPDRTLPAVPPPPLPATAPAPASIGAGESTAGIVWLTGAVAAAICVATVAWGVWWRLGNEPETPSVAASNARANDGPVVPDDATTGETAVKNSADEDQPIAGTDSANPPTSEASETARGSSRDPNQTELGAGSPSDPPVQEEPSKPAYETAASKAVATAQDAPPPANADDRSLPSTAASASAMQDAAINEGDSRVARKPALEMHELPGVPAQLTDPAEAPSLGADSAVPPVEPVEAAVPSAAAPVEHEASSLPPLRRIAPKDVDIPACLAAKLVAVEFDGAALHEAIAQMSRLGGVTISLSPDALRSVGVDVRQRVRLTAQSTTVGAVLKQLLAPLGLEAREVQGQLLVTTVGGVSARRARYAVDDLVRAGDPTIDELAALVQAILNHADQSDVSAAEIRVVDGALHLTANQIGHDLMIELCEKLRVARGRPLRSRYSANRPDPRFDPERFELGSRRSKAKSILDRKVTAGIGRATPLTEVVAYLSNQTGATILVDGPALAAAGLSIETEASLVVVEQRLEMALVRLLEPLGLVHRALPGNAIEITSPEAAGRRLDVELYPVRGLFPDDAAPAATIETYRNKLLSAAGLEISAGEVFFDSPGQCLIVLASYPAQGRLEQAITTMNRGAGERGPNAGSLKLRNTIDSAASRR